MYTGEADHRLTAELVELVDVPVVASGDVVSHARAVEILRESTRAEAVMVGRAAQGNPWTLREIIDGVDERRHAPRWPRSWFCSSARRCGSSARDGRPVF